MSKIISWRGEQPLVAPFFMPIATKAAVKGLTVADLKLLKTKVVLSNTYHLWLRPGVSVLEEAGGLGSFMGWSGPILTDSGGYQMFSLGARLKSKSGKSMVKITEEGVWFRDYLSGAKHFMTPEDSLDIQAAIDSDFRLLLDLCSPYPVSYQQAALDVDQTFRWAQRSKRYIDQHWPEGSLRRPNFIPIIQGGIFPDLRQRSLEQLLSLDFDGYAIGGVAVGEPWEEALAAIRPLIDQLPANKLRYLMGVGKPEQLVTACQLGIDAFDCVIPTREARHGRLYFKLEGVPLSSKSDFYQVLNLKNNIFATDQTPINAHSKIPELQTYSRSYLRHLFITADPLATRLATLNNLEFYLGLTS